jgi:phosphatidylglycerophosphate synthase
VVIVLTVAIVTVAVGRRQFRPSIYGKAATAIYIITCVVVRLFYFLERASRLVTVCVYLSLAITLVSGIHYIVHVARTINQPQTAVASRPGRLRA